ncbi:hypothetical protein ONE63_006859 [Megalurothrips usitatus]|uniref:Rho-GAP domain-containing protein n=1 Tax=Megalurothrips usitatus TaxID=439358 RepID=A0AAV7XX58_9NEOP|nr:hypothetical protein ONE63_006859 [Megalurothrips usitatus]
MRRPTLCGDAHPVDHDGDDDAAYLHPSRPSGGRASSRTSSAADRDGQSPGQGQGRLSRVKRLLADSLLLGGRRGGGGGGGGGGGMGAGTASKQFGVPLCDVALNKEGVPIVVVKICSYLENHGLQCEGLFQSSTSNPRLAERLRSTLDLDGANDVFTTALLLLLWLKELPEPIVWGHIASELLATHGKVSEEPVGTWRQAIRLVLCTLPETNLRLLRYILRFLHRYSHHQQQRSSKSGAQSMLNHLGTIFAPLLILRGLEYNGGDQLSKANILTSRLIQDHASVFHQWLLDHPNEILSSPKHKSPGSRKKHHQGGSVRKNVEDAENTNCSQHRKRKERNESANSNQSLERKVIRSSSEERHVELAVADNKNESIRRVNSHEDFSHVKRQVKASSTINRNRFTTVVELSDQPQTVGLPLQECNHIEASVQAKDAQPSLQTSLYDYGSQQKENELQKDQQQSLRARDRSHTESLEDEHEKRRSSERFSRSVIPPRSVVRRNVGRKKRNYQSNLDKGVSAKLTLKQEKREVKLPYTKNMPQTTITHASELPKESSFSSEEQDDDADPEAEIESLSDESRPGSSHSFLQLHPPERERSPSPSISPCTPPLDLTTLHQSVDGSEPVASRVGWDFARPQHQGDDGGRGILLSPRNSMILTRRVFMDHNVPPSPPGDHHGSCLPGPASDLENLVKKLNKQITSIKKKLKRYEEGFEREFGYRPSQSDKMANKDIKKMCSDLSRLRKELKRKSSEKSQLSQNPPISESFLFCTEMKENPLSAIPNGSIEDTVAEVERRLKDKRLAAGRPESLDDMTPEQHASEKLALQKALLLLEKICGRASSKQDREIVRPLYDRYRQLKRIVARAASSKLKDSINELATIHEHEAMDFTPSTSLLAMTDGGLDASSSSSTQGCSSGTSSNVSASGASINSVLQTQPSTEETSDSQTSSSDSLGENLHALPLSDLVLQLTQTRDEKKKLRRLLREYEEQFQQETGRRMQREDRAIVAGDTAAKEYSVTYSSYKQMKAKLRLLEALVAKQR